MPETPTFHATRLRRHPWNDWTKALVAVVAWHVVLSVVAYLFQGSQHLNYAYPPNISTDPTPLSHMCRFDGLY
ncbi:hypothetical protein ACQPW3_13030 [Actinosynnema sp. CA-248983]